jgi:ATP-grasp domain-containing protein
VRAMVDALGADGHVHHLVWLNKGLEIPVIPDLPDGTPLVCHGPAFIPRALNHARLRSGLFFDSATFCWSAFSTGWKGSMLSSDGRVVSLSAARELLHSGAKAFVRPDSDSKLFEGGVYDSSALGAILKESRVSGATPVVVASPVNIDAEWRFFVVASEIVGCSEYRRWGRLSTQGSVPQAAVEFAQETALKWSPHNIYCLDLASADGRLGVLEANCFNASRLYGAVVSRVLQAVNAYVLAHFE